MSLKFHLFLISEGSSIDSRSSTISVFNILEEFNAAGFPVIVPKITILAMASRETSDPKDFVVDAEFFLDDKKLTTFPLNFNFQDHLRARNVSEIHGMVLEKPGNIIINASLKGNILATWTSPIKSIGQPKITEITAGSS